VRLAEATLRNLIHQSMPGYFFPSPLQPLVRTARLFVLWLTRVLVGRTTKYQITLGRKKHFFGSTTVV
jgi:hypothetical protein